MEAWELGTLVGLAIGLVVGILVGGLVGVSMVNLQWDSQIRSDRMER